MAKAEITYEHQYNSIWYTVMCDCGEPDLIPSAWAFYICDRCGKRHDTRPLIKAWIKRPGRLRRLQDHRDELIANLQDIEGQIAKMLEAEGDS